MRDRDLYAKILGISAPWHGTDVVLDVAAGTVEVFVEHGVSQAATPWAEPGSRFTALLTDLARRS